MMNEFRILYVEDDADKAAEVKAAIEGNVGTSQVGGADRGPIRKLVVATLTDPKRLRQRLDEGFDVVLADIMFPVGKEGAEENCLGLIIATVREWSRANGVFPALPIIAYTSFAEAFRTSLDYGAEIYDIWDKVLAVPQFVAWRFRRLAVELSRTRPDALLQQLIRRMKSDLKWHSDVVEMTRKYTEGWTEADQIRRAGTSISNIGAKIGTPEAINAFWQAMMVWEPLIRSVAEGVRGHARHVINVFWLGYWILHNGSFRKWLDAESDQRFEELCTAWFFAGLFHDVAGCVEKQGKVSKALSTLMAPFPTIFTKTAVKEVDLEEATKLASEGEHVIEHFANIELKQAVLAQWRKSIGKQEPDHGIVAAIHLIRSIGSGSNHAAAVMAAKAMVLHNLIGSLPPDLVNWSDEPLSCLLILCDQLQTWDRERGTDSLHQKPQPQRAELSGIEFVEAEHNQLNIAIDYIATRKAERDSDTYKELREDLETVLREKPCAALRRIRQPWEPFRFAADFSLNGERMDVGGFEF